MVWKFQALDKSLDRPLYLGGMADGLEVLGIGEISWTFVACDHTKVQIVTDGFYVPQGEARLLCLSAYSTRKKVFQGFSSY